MRSFLGRTSDRLLAFAAVVLLLAMLACVFFGVVFRFINRPLAWSDEMAQYLLVWMAFIGWIIAGNRNSHIRVTVLIDRLKGRARDAAEIFMQLTVLFLGLVLMTRSFGLIERNMDVEWVSLPLSVALVYIPVPIAGFAIVVQCCLRILDIIRGDRSSETSRSVPL
ncbi:MAG: TRAP transporter small permease [Rhizobiaceae bacterium]